MAPKRPLEASETAPEAKKQKHGFRVGPENLPDGAWRRKVTKIKKDLIHKAKIKKAYAKIKAREHVAKPQDAVADEGGSEQEDAEQEEPVMDELDGALDQDDRESNGSEGEEEQGEEEEIHPTRKLMLKDEEMAQAGAEPDKGHGPSDGQRRRTRRPGYYDKQLQKAEQKKTEAENRRKEFERRNEERRQKTAERDRFKRAMAKTRDRDGNKKLGRESALLLEKVKKLVAQK